MAPTEAEIKAAIAESERRAAQERMAANMAPPPSDVPVEEAMTRARQMSSSGPVSSQGPVPEVTPAPAPPPDAKPGIMDKIRLTSPLKPLTDTAKGVYHAIADGDAAPPPEAARAPSMPNPSTPDAGGGPLPPPVQMAGPGRMLPGGWRPQSMDFKSEGAVPVSPEARQANDSAFNSTNVAGALTHDADKAFYGQVRDAQAMRMQASQDAAAQTAAVQAERDETRRIKLAHIEELNNEANAKIDPNKSWNDKGALARILGAVAIGLGEFSSKMRGGPNTAAQIIDSQIQREIDAQIANQKIAARKANSEETLLGLHMDRFKDMDTAIHATKLGLYDKAAAAADRAAAEHGISLTDPKWLEARAQMFSGRANVLNDMDKQEMGKQTREYREVYAPPQMVGAGVKSAPFVLNLPAHDGSHGPVNVSVPEKAYDDLRKAQEAVTSVNMLNLNALKLRKDLRETGTAENYRKHPLETETKVATIRAELAKTQADRISTWEHGKDNSVLREPEFERAIKNGPNYLGGFMGHTSPGGVDNDTAIMNDSNIMQAMVNSKVEGVGAEHVSEVAHQPGQASQWQYMGQRYKAPPVIPEGKKK